MGNTVVHHILVFLIRISSALEHPINAASPMNETLSWIMIRFSEEQPRKAEWPTCRTVPECSLSGWLYNHRMQNLILSGSITLERASQY